jgi:hypothetical protein
MAAETLTFSCPRCQIRLNVPASMAGVSGPCPSCREQITAPRKVDPAAEEAVEALPAAREEAAAPREADPLHRKNPPPGPLAPRDEPAVASPLAPRDERSSATAVGPRLRPEPRRKPERPQPLKPLRSTDDPLFSRGEAPLLRQAAGGRRPYRWFHALYPAVFLVMATTLVGVLLYHYAPGGPGRRIARLFQAPEVAPPPASSPAAPGHGTGIPPEAVLPAPSDPGIDRSLATDSTILLSPEKSPSILANELLETFLAAPDAASRTELVEPATTQQELAATLLKGPLPDVARIAADLPEQRPEEQLTDFPFRVSFFVRDAPAVEFGVLVRQRGSQPPRVFLPAFLDLVGGRLTEFTRQPNRRPPATFHVHLEPIADCYEKNVPGADRKFTLKLHPGPAGKETARAYAANASSLKEQMDSPSSPIRWGIRRRATVTLRWNHKEDPERPYLELIDINSPDWNP